MKILLGVFFVTLLIYCSSASSEGIDASVCGGYQNILDRNECCAELGIPIIKCLPNKTTTLNEESNDSQNANSQTNSGKMPDYLYAELFNLISANDLYEEFDKNEIAAEAKYKGKDVVVTGVVVDVKKNIVGQPLVNLDAGTLRYVSCRFPKTSTSLLIHIQKGENVKFACKVGHKIITTIHLSDCSVQ